jgi:aryl-alcohol dehydrogenase-like predicted oxidoreductase
VSVSAIGLGGFHIGQMRDEEASVRLVRDAVDRGITFCDNCWDYNGGASELRMGRALRDGYRAKVFLMTKIDGRTKDAAARQIDESLGRLGTDHVDLLQIHEVIRVEDPDRVFAEGGAIEAVLAARRAGKTRFIGFTGHKDPLVHLRMLDVAAAHDVRFDTVQMPLNLMDHHFRSFEHGVLPRLVAEGIGVLGMKSMGDKLLLESGAVTRPECLRYALSLPTSTVITGIDAPSILDQALAAATAPSLSDGEVQALRDKTETAASSGRYELFKTSDRFDATAKHPEWLV